MKLNKREIGKKRNVLKRYQLYLDEFNKYDCRITPITVIHREYIFPKFGISRETLYKALNTPIDEELEKLKAIETNQIPLFE